jgi:hypothetical protein
MDSGYTDQYFPTIVHNIFCHKTYYRIIKKTNDHPKFIGFPDTYVMSDRCIKSNVSAEEYNMDKFNKDSSQLNFSDFYDILFINDGDGDDDIIIRMRELADITDLLNTIIKTDTTESVNNDDGIETITSHSINYDERVISHPDKINRSNIIKTVDIVYDIYRNRLNDVKTKYMYEHIVCHSTITGIIKYDNKHYAMTPQLYELLNTSTDPKVQKIAKKIFRTYDSDDDE